MLSPAAVAPVTTLWEIGCLCLCPPPSACIFTAAAACTSALECFCAHHINVIFHSSCFHLFPLYCNKATLLIFCLRFILGVVNVCCAGCDFKWFPTADGLRCCGQSLHGLLLLCLAVKLSLLRISPPRQLLLFAAAGVPPSRMVPAARQYVFTPSCCLVCLPYLRRFCGSKFGQLA